MFFRSRGVSLIEMMIGLAIGSVIIIGTVFVYSQTRNSYTVNETQARLQEAGRYALAIIEPDLQLAGYLGFSNEANDFYYLRSGTRTSVIDLESNDTALTGTGVPTAINACGTNFVVDLLKSVQGSNGVAGPLASCAPPTVAPNNAGAYVAGTDTLTIRRAATEPAAAASATKVQLYLNSIKRTNQSIFVSGTAPGAITTTPPRQVRDLIVRTYYVATNSASRANYPSLWRKSLGTNAGAPAIIDEEILPGVEDFQIEFGVDTGDHDGTAGVDPAIDKVAPIGMPDYFNGVVSRWVTADNSLLDPTIDGRYAQVVAVRVWLRMRADAPETAFTDNRTYTYAGNGGWNAAVDAPAVAGFRRTLMSRTVYLRNVRMQ